MKYPMAILWLSYGYPMVKVVRGVGEASRMNIRAY